jgi:hypothetical protein
LRRNTSITLVAGIVLVAAGLWFATHWKPSTLLARTPPKAAGVTATSETGPPKLPFATAAATPGEPSGAPPASLPATMLPGPPLPSTDLPLSAIVDGLRARARAGDPPAACRLAAELERCARVGEVLARTAEQARMADETAMRLQDEATRERQRQSSARAFSATAEKALAESRQCESVILESPSERIAYWRQAALGGSRAALRHYAVGNAFQWRSFLDTADLLPRYRAEAEEFARRAAAGGDGVAVLALVNAYSPIQREMSMNFLSQATAEDAVEAVALLRFALSTLPPSDQPTGQDMQKTLARKLDELLPTLDADEQVDAENRLSRYLAEWSRPTPPSAAEIQALQWGGVAPIARETCSEPQSPAHSR